MYEYTSFSLYNINVNWLKNISSFSYRPFGRDMDCSVGCSEVPKKDTSKTAPLDVKKVWSHEEAFLFLGCFLPLQFFTTNSI